MTFLFTTCQLGAESAVKAELARDWPALRLAYSRPGFLTFKLPEGLELAADFALKSVFARSYGFSLGKVEGTDSAQRAHGVWELWGARPVDRIHVWQRDQAPAGDEEVEPGASVLVTEAREQLLQAVPRSLRLAANAANPRAAAEPGETILDCVLVEPHQWWIGYHQARWFASRWPGGAPWLEPPGEMVSRAWLKMEEALRWSGLPVPVGARWAEIGSAPGGASQALLARGLYVTGIDPAQMDPRVLANARFTHIRRRSNEVRRRDFRKIRWLSADMNVAPSYTLEAVAAICQHPEVNVRGMLLTLKLPQWELAAELPALLCQIRGWGYNRIRARQLYHNRQEVCVAAVQKPFRRKTMH